MGTASYAALVELGERYAAQGLPSAARGAFLRALSADSGVAAAAARRLAELAIGDGDGPGALQYAQLAVKGDPGPSARLLLGRAQLAAHALDPARMAFVASLEAAGTQSVIRARAHLGIARCAAAQGDPAGAAANAMAGVDELLGYVAAPGRVAADVDAELPLLDEMIGLATSLGRAGDIEAAVRQLRESGRAAPCDLLDALRLAARQANGDADIGDAEIEAALEAELAARPLSRATRTRLVERQLRRRYRDEAARAGAITELLRLRAELTDGKPTVAHNVELARVYFLLAAAFEGDPATASEAEEAFRGGLALQPGHAAAANRLAQLTLARGDCDAALVDIERALRIDGHHRLAWHSAARALDTSAPGPELERAVERLFDSAVPGAGAGACEVVPRLLAATAEVARGDVLAGMHARGHRLKNLLGIVGSRTRSARKLAGDGELMDRLTSLESDVTSLYDEWASYLRSMQATGGTIEVVPVSPLLAEVIDAASAHTSVKVRGAIDAGLPDLRGDRMLMREALLNIVSNAAEACEAAGGAVYVRARAVTSRGTPIVEIEIEDTGPGIDRADLARVFAPGFTTKETGSGIGLSVAERVVSSHHGRISIDSEVGRGTRILVMLPSDLGGFSRLALFARRPDMGEDE